MFISRSNAIRLMAAASFVAMTAGCSSESKESYPAPQQSQMTPQAPTPAQVAAQASIQVPAGAQLVAAGEPPIPAFAAPGAGTLYVYDNQNDTVVKVTSIAASQTGQPIDLNQLANVSNSLDPHHRFSIYFLSAGTSTTLPAAIGH